MASDEPMSDARLAEIRALAEQPFNGAGIIRELLAEVEWLRARERHELYEFVRRVAESNPATYSTYVNYDKRTQQWQSTIVNHFAEEARALLAAAEPTDATTAERK